MIAFPSPKDRYFQSTRNIDDNYDSDCDDDYDYDYDDDCDDYCDDDDVLTLCHHPSELQLYTVKEKECPTHYDVSQCHAHVMALTHVMVRVSLCQHVVWFQSVL